MTSPSTPTLPMQQPPLRKAVQFGAIPKATGQRVLLYGTSGIGKTTLACQAPGPVAFIDLEESLPTLQSRLGDITKNISVVSGVRTFGQLREALQSPGWDRFKTLVIDSVTKAEELAIQHTLDTIKNEKGQKVSSIEAYGYGKGYTHLYEVFMGVLADLDAHARAGRNIVLVCHDCTANVPNPEGDDWLRYEPRLQNPTSGKASIRAKVREWADHVLFFSYDRVVEDGVAKGGDSRTIYASELPHCMAKSRTTSGQIPVTGADIWNQIIK